MPSLKLTKRAIDALAAPDPSGKQRLYWDSDLRGFGLLVSGTTTAKSYVVQHTMHDGKSRRITVAPANTIDLDEARSQAKALIAQFYQGVDPKAEERKAREEAKRQRQSTLRAVLDDYLERNNKLTATTKQYYRRMVERHLAAWLDIPLATITPQMIEQRHGAIAAEIAERNRGSRRGGGPTTGQGSANSTMYIFSLLWNWKAAPHRSPELGLSPTRALKGNWYDQERRERLVKADDLPAFYRAVDGLPSRTQRDYLMLLLFTGLRRREAGSLRWDDIDFAAKLIRVSASATKAGRKLDLPMSSFVRDLLVARRALGRDGEYVFAAASKSGHIEDAKQSLALVAEETSIEICMHDLRRTFVTHAEETEMSIYALKALVNHVLPEKRDVTAGYVRMTAERLRIPAQRVCDRLLALCGIEQQADVARMA